MEEKRKIVQTHEAPPAIGPYSQAVIYRDLIFTSGQIGMVPDTGEMVSDELEAQTRQVFANLKAVLAAAGSSLEQAIKATVYLKDMNDFPKFNEIYSEYFMDVRPSRSTVQAARLPKDARVEIDIVATLE